MATIWIFNSMSDSGHNPAIAGQLLNLSDNTLCLRNPWVTDSVFMGKLYCAMTLALMIGFYPYLLSSEAWDPYIFSPIFITSVAFGPFIFLPFLFYRIYFIQP